MPPSWFYREHFNIQAKRRFLISQQARPNTTINPMCIKAKRGFLLLSMCCTFIFTAVLPRLRWENDKEDHFMESPKDLVPPGKY